VFCLRSSPHSRYYGGLNIVALTIKFAVLIIGGPTDRPRGRGLPLSIKARAQSAGVGGFGDPSIIIGDLF
jgi:hypothetical protein